MITEMQWAALKTGSLVHLSDHSGSSYWQVYGREIVCVQGSVYWLEGHQVPKPDYDTSAAMVLWDPSEVRVAQYSQSVKVSSPSEVRAEEQRSCSCDFRGANAWLGCRCGALARERAGQLEVA